MSFANSLQRLREARDARQHGRDPRTRLVRLEDLDALLRDWERLDDAVRTRTKLPTGVLQTRFGAPEGNCYQAAIATLLGVDLDEVPDYDRADEAGNWPDYCERLEAWLRDRGLSLRSFGTFRDGTPFVSAPNGTLVLVGGPSPRGDFDHICVARKEEAGLVWHHDPHPSCAFVSSPRWVEFIVPTGEHQ